MEPAQLTAERFSELEEFIYEASVVPSQWPEVLERLGEVGGGEGSVLFSVSNYGSLWTASARVHELMRRFVEEGWAERNTRMANGLRKGAHLAPIFVTEADYYEDNEQETDPLYTEFFRPAGFGHSAGMVAVLPHEDMICVSIERALDKGPVTPSGLASLNSLRPHVARSAMLTARLGLERVRSAVETLTQLGFAAAAVSSSGKVLVTNADFEARAMPWTTGLHDRLGLLDARANGMLRGALERIGTADGVRSIPLRDDDGIIRNVLHVLPVRRLAHDIFSGASAILVVTTSAGKPDSPHLLQALFDLTPAEAVIANAIRANLTVEQIAVREGRSIATVRNQLKSVLGKTGCTRQAELVRMLALVVPPGL
jgi:DNA-binding CsgD family transcriptional regulator